MSRSIVLFTALLFQVLSVWPQERGFSFNRLQRSVNIPVQISHNLIIVSMQINGSPPLNFILDSGVNTTILTEPIIANILGIDTPDKILLRGLGDHGIIEARLAEGVTLTLPGITGQNMNLIVLPEGIISFSEHFGFPIHGIIGNDLFREFAVRINYERKMIRIFRRPNYRIPRRAAKIPLEIINNKPYISVSVESRTGKRIDSLDLLIDLGASYPAYLHNQYTNLAPTTIPSYLGRGLSGDLHGVLGRIQEMNLNGFIIKNPTIAFPRFDLSEFSLQTGWDGIIGGGILKRFHIIIDYPSQRLIIWQNQNFNMPFSSNLSGIEFTIRGAEWDQFIINYVRKKSVAYEQNIRPGDRLLKINNTRVEKLGADKVIELLTRHEGKEVHLHIQRNEKILLKSFTLREDLP